jgi:triphosphatase
MEKNQEIELKLTIFDQGEENKIICDEFLLSLTASKWQTAQLISTYYDTRQRILQKNRLTFRIRNTGQGYEATVKGGGHSEGGLHERQEWNVPLTVVQADSSIFSATAVGEKLRQLVNEEELHPIFTTEFVRNKLLVHYGTSLIEIAVDHGEISVGELHMPISELELELKSGSPIDLIYLGGVLAERFQLRLEQRSKYQRGIALAGVFAVDKPLRSDQPLYLLWTYLEKEMRFVASPGTPTARYEVIQYLDKLQLKIMKLAAGVNRQSHCLEVLDDFRLLFQPLREADFIGVHYRRLIDSGEITPSYHRELGQAYRSHLHKTTHSLITALRQGRTTSYVLKLWAILLEGNNA